MDEDRRPRIPDRWILPGLAEEHAPFPGCAPDPSCDGSNGPASRSAPTGACAQPPGRAERDPAAWLPPAARVLIHDVKQRWAPPKASPGFGERPAERLAASQSVVTENTFGPGRCAIVANASWTSGPTTEPRWLGQADRRKRASPPAGCFRWGYWSAKAVFRQSQRGSLRGGRVQACRGKPCPIGEGYFSKNRSSHLTADRLREGCHVAKTRHGALSFEVRPQNPSRSKRPYSRPWPIRFDTNRAKLGQRGNVRASSTAADITERVAQCHLFKMTSSISPLLIWSVENGWPLDCAALSARSISAAWKLQDWSTMLG